MANIIDLDAAQTKHDIAAITTSFTYCKNPKAAYPAQFKTGLPPATISSGISPSFCQEI